MTISIINLKRLLLIIFVSIFAATNAQSAMQSVTRIDEFDEDTLPAFWTLDDANESYDPNTAQTPTPGARLASSGLSSRKLINTSILFAFFVRIDCIIPVAMKFMFL